MDPDKTASIGAVCSGSMLFPSIPYWSVMLGNYLQQTTSADNIFRCIFSWRFKGYDLSGVIALTDLYRRYVVSFVCFQFRVLVIPSTRSVVMDTEYEGGSAVAQW